MMTTRDRVGHELEEGKEHATNRSSAQRLKPFLSVLVWLAIAVWSGCAGQGAPERTPGQVLYYDRNGDGRVDLEKHQFPNMADADWELRDDNFDGRYERKVLYGYAVTESPVDLPVPTKVRLEAKP